MYCVYGNSSWYILGVPLFGGGPLLGGSIIRGSTVIRKLHIASGALYYNCVELVIGQRSVPSLK